MDKINYDEINDARNILELDEEASLEEVKRAYRRLSKIWHPDKCKEDEDQCHEMMKKINKAYTLIKKHIENYKCSFKKEKIVDKSVEGRWQKQFGDDPVWGKGE